MRKIPLLIVLTSLIFYACSVGKGCPSNGKNIGAERILSGDPKAAKALKKATKFRD